MTGNNSRATQIFAVTSINAASLASTKIMTTENGNQSFYPMAIMLECTAATAVTIVGSGSIGTNATSYNDVLAITAMTGLTTTGQCLYIPLSTVSKVIAANTDVFFKLTTAITGTSQTVAVYLIGFYGP